LEVIDMAIGLEVSSRRAMRVIDVFFVIWTIGWLAGGIYVGRQVYELRQLGDTVDSSAQALQETGDAMDSLSGVPFVGDRIGNVADRINATARQASESADRSRQTAERLGWVLGSMIAAIAVLPMVVIYVVVRRRWTRNRRALREAQGDPTVDSEELRDFLVLRALATMSLTDLEKLHGGPWRNGIKVERELAAAELRRYGLSARGVASAG
jgi:hypothetical protein